MSFRPPLCRLERVFAPLLCRLERAERVERPRRLAGAAVLLALFAGAPAAQAQLGPPPPQPMVAPDQQLAVYLDEVDIEQKLGAQVPMDVPFSDETGRTVTLGEIAAGRPLVLVPAYYDCPMLCSMVLGSMAAALDTLAFDAGREYQVAVVSFAPAETPEMAASEKERVLRRYDHPGADQGFRFLTGEESSIRAVMDTIGYHYEYVPDRGEYSHAAGVVLLTPRGRVARYFMGIEYPPRDLRLALVDAADESIGSPVDHVLLYCLRYNPASGRYSVAVLRLVRLGGLLTLAALAVYFLISWRRRRLRPTLEDA